jgi:hypothetical protein
MNAEDVLVCGAQEVVRVLAPEDVTATAANDTRNVNGHLAD